MKRIALIMAGGVGERFWPLSRKNRPKQLLPLLSEKTMIEETIQRITPLFKNEDIFIITSETLLEPIRRVLTMLPPENIVAEPSKRNTAPCLALGAAFIAERYSKTHQVEEISIAVLTSDQSIKPNKGFIKTIGAALQQVEMNNTLCTIGIVPNRPDTGYGYIEMKEKFSGAESSTEIQPVAAFHEKPDLETANKFVKGGKHLWNSGMFFWRLDIFIENLKLYLPEVGDKIEIMRKYYRKKTHLPLPESLNSLKLIYSAFPNVSIDYGLMEKANNVSVAKALFEWDDVGSWDSLERFKKINKNNNIIEGTVTNLNSKNSIIINNSTKIKKIVACVGLEEMIVVVTDDAVLICPKDSVQDVKKCVEQIKSEHGEYWL